MDRDAQAIDIYNALAAKPSETVPATMAQLDLADLYAGEGKMDQARTLVGEDQGRRQGRHGRLRLRRKSWAPKSNRKRIDRKRLAKLMASRVFFIWCR